MHGFRYWLFHNSTLLSIIWRMKKLAVLFFCFSSFYSWGQSNLGAFVGIEGGIYFPSPYRYKEVYPNDVLSYGISGGIGSDWLYVVAKYRRFNTEGTPILGNISAPDANASWSQSATAVGLRFLKKKTNADFHFDVLYCTTRAKEEIRLNDPDFTQLDQDNRMNASGVALGAGLEKKIVGILSLTANAELASARTKNKNGVAGKNINLGYFFIGLGLSAKIF